MIGLSNAPFQAFQPQPQVAPSTVPTFNPGTVQNPFFSQFTNEAGGTASPQPGLSGTNSLRTLSYPLDSPKYIMTFSIGKYSRTDLNSIGQFVDANYPGIVLPLPQQLVDVNHVNWHEVEVGTLPGTFVSGLAQAIRNPTAGNIATAAGAGALNFLGLAGSAVNTFTGNVIGNAVGRMIPGFEAWLGAAPNQFLTLLMRGPLYKRHKFTWEFSPNNFEEANELNRIITTFKNAMSPNIFKAISGIPVLWEFPKIFRIRLYPNSQFLYKFKPCICDFFVVNEAPGGRASFRTKGTPAIVQIQANFIELEFWIEGNYGSGTTSDPSNDPSDVQKVLPNG